MMSIKADAPVGALVAMPRLKAHQVTGVSPTGNYETLCGKVVGPAAQQTDDANLCATCKRMSAAQEAPQTESETPVQEAAPAPVAPRPEPVNRDVPVLADKLVLPDPDALARETDPDNRNPHDRLGVLELGKDRIRPGRRRKVSDREKKRDHKPLPEKQALITPVGSRLNDPGNHVGGLGTTAPDPVVARADGPPMLPRGETGRSGSYLDPECVTLDVVGGAYGWLTITQFRAEQVGMTDNQARNWRQRYRRKVKQNRQQKIRPLLDRSNRVVSIERVRGAK